MGVRLFSALLAGAALAGATDGSADTYPWPNELRELTQVFSFDSGTFASQTAVFKAGFELYDVLDEAFIDDDFVYFSGGCPPVSASISFAGLESSDPGGCVFVLDGLSSATEISSVQFSFDPVANPYGIEALGVYGSSMVVFGSEFDDITRTSTRTDTVTPIAPVPLPATAVLMLAGLGALGVAARRSGRPV